MKGRSRRTNGVIVSGLEEMLEADGSLEMAARQVIAMLVLELEGSLA